MTHEKMTPLRERMIEDMRIHGIGQFGRNPRHKKLDHPYGGKFQRSGPKMKFSTKSAQHNRSKEDNANCHGIGFSP